MIAIDQAAEKFFSTTEPMVVMRMPGCQPVCVNREHDSWLAKIGPLATLSHASFRDEVAESPSQFLKAVSAASRADRKACYCERINAILSLRAPDCVFEGLHSEHLETERSPQRGFEFYLQPGSQNGSREYDIARVHTWLLDTKDRNLLLARLTPSQFLAASVTLGFKAESRIAWSAKITLRQSPKALALFKITDGTSEVDAKTYEPYRLFDEALRQAEDNLPEAPSLLHGALDQMLGSAEDYEDYGGFGFFVDHMLIQPDMPRVLRQVRERLWDGPALAGEVRTALSKFLDSSDLHFPLNVRHDVLRLRMSIDRLEARDHRMKFTPPDLVTDLGKAGLAPRD